ETADRRPADRRPADPPPRDGHGPRSVLRPDGARAAPAYGGRMGRHAMSSADAAWLRMDRPESQMAITSVLWFDGQLQVDEVRAVLRERLVERFPRFRQRAV